MTRHTATDAAAGTLPCVSSRINIGLSTAIQSQQGDVATVVGQGSGRLRVAPPLTIDQSQEHIAVAGSKSQC